MGILDKILPLLGYTAHTNKYNVLIIGDGIDIQGVMLFREYQTMCLDWVAKEDRGTYTITIKGILTSVSIILSDITGILADPKPAIEVNHE